MSDEGWMGEVMQAITDDNDKRSNNNKSSWVMKFMSDQLDRERLRN
jgi:hypothetical protein